MRRLIPLVLLAAIAILAAAAPLFVPAAPDAIDLYRIYEPPSQYHPFGTDGLGRDLLARTLAGLRLSLLVAAFAAFVALAVGMPAGVTAGYAGGWVDAVVMRLVDLLAAFPFPVLAILLAVVLGQGLPGLLILLALFGWLDVARITRVGARRLRGREFVLAARGMGAGKAWIVARHLAPNLTRETLAGTIMAMRDAVFVEATLGFLGIGVQAPLVSLGALVDGGYRALRVAPWELVFPAATLTLVLLAFHALGDALGNALDPRSRSDGYPRRRPARRGEV